MNGTMRKRIRERLEQVKKSEYEVAIEAGLNRSYLYEFMTGRKESLRPANLRKIADVLDCDPRFLTGELSSPRAQGGGARVDGDSRMLVVDQLVEDGVWAPASRRIPTAAKVHADPRFPQNEQSAFQVLGNRWASAGIGDSSIITAVRGLPPTRPGDLVVVRRVRGKDEVQLTIGQYDGKEIFLNSGATFGSDAGIRDEALGVIVAEHRIF